MPTTPHPMKRIYEVLRGIGLTKPYVRDVVLPEWWDDEAAETPSGLAQVQMLVARHTGIDFKALRDGEPVTSVPLPVRFKRRSGTTGSDVELATRLAMQAARLASSTLSATTPPRLSAVAIREQILDTGAPWVSLEGLVAWCYDHGIAVLHLGNLPAGRKKMDGLAARLDGRLSIVLASKKRSAAWALFVLAHELGHLMLGHVDEGSFFIDEDLDAASTDEERDADRFALELLTGNGNTRFLPAGTWPNAAGLASVAQVQGKQRQIDPGHIILNFGMSTKLWPLAQAALLRVQDPDGPEVVLRHAADRLDWSQLPEDSSAFLEKLTRRPEPEAA